MVLVGCFVLSLVLLLVLSFFLSLARLLARWLITCQPISSVQCNICVHLIFTLLQKFICSEHNVVTNRDEELQKQCINTQIRCNLSPSLSFAFEMKRNGTCIFVSLLKLKASCFQIIGNGI